MGVFYRPPGLSSTMELPFTILQKVKKFYKPDHPTKKSFEFEPPHRQSTNTTVPYGPYCSCTVPTTHTLPVP